MHPAPFVFLTMLATPAAPWAQATPRLDAASAITVVLNKCPASDGRFDGRPILVVDGVVQDASEGGDIETIVPTAEIYRLEIVCWDPETNTFRDRGIPTIFILSRSSSTSYRASWRSDGIRLADGRVPTAEELLPYAFPPRGRSEARTDP